MTLRPPVVLVHGAFSVPEHLEGLTALFEADGYPVHSVRLRGHGNALEHVVQGASMQDYLADVLRVVDSVGEPAIIVGHSMGGLLALKAAEARPCRALLLLAPAPPGPLMVSVAGLSVYASILPRVLAGRVVVPPKAQLERLALHNVPEEDRRVLLDRLVPESGRAIRDMMFGLMRVKRDRLTAPIALVSGTKDVLVPPWQLRATARRVGAQHLCYKGMGHFLIGEHGWERVANDIRRWLAGALALAPAQQVPARR